MRLRVTIGLCAAALTTVSCSVTRRIPEGEYLLVKNRVEVDRTVPRDERITAQELEKYIRQKPNRRLLGTNFYAWIYSTADTARNTWWNRFKRRIGQAPVLLDTTLTRRSAENMKVYMNSRGFFRSEDSYAIDSTTRYKKASVTYRVRQGEPYRIERMHYDFRDRFLAPILTADTASSLIRAGDIFDITLLARERQRLASYLNDRGYYNFTVENILYRADTTVGGYGVDLTTEVRQHLAGYDAKGRPEMENNRVYRLRSIRIDPDFDPSVAGNDTAYLGRLDTLRYRGLEIVHDGRLHLRRKILRQSVDLFPGYLYDYAEVRRTYDNLMRLGYFRSASILFDVVPDSVMEHRVTYIGDGDEPLADSVLSTREGYLDCNIRCTPALRQSYKIELEGSTTQNYYGLKATVGYQNRNLFRGAELFDASFYVGNEFMKGKMKGKKSAFEIGGGLSLSFPRFIVPWHVGRSGAASNARTKIELAINRQNRPYYRRTLSSAGWGYSWNSGRYAQLSVRPVDLNLVKVAYIDSTWYNSLQNKYLQNSYHSQLIAGISGAYVFNNQLRTVDGNATMLRINWETAGNLVDGLAHLFARKPADREYYKIFGIRFAQYVRVDVSLARKEALAPRTAIAWRLYGGLAKAYGNSSSVPFDRLFYAGGSSSMRGWAPRTLGPGSVPRPTDQLWPSQLGDMKLEANLELRFPIWGIFNGALFFDCGNIWYMNRRDSPPAGVFRFGSFYKQLGLDGGVGIRIDIKFAVLRFDWGIKLHDPNLPAGERWIRHFRLRNTLLNFGVGYPF